MPRIKKPTMESMRTLLSLLHGEQADCLVYSESPSNGQLVGELTYMLNGVKHTLYSVGANHVTATQAGSPAFISMHDRVAILLRVRALEMLAAADAHFVIECVP